MKELAPSQLKTLSEFLNTVAAAWFTAGVISPFFIKQENIVNVIILAVAAILMSLLFLSTALVLVRRIKI